MELGQVSVPGNGTRTQLVSVQLVSVPCQIVGQFRRRLQPRFEPTRQVGRAVPSRKAQPLGRPAT